MLAQFSASGRLPTLKCVYQEQNVGPLENWRACLRHSSADYVHWHWSDDHVDIGFYTVAMSHLSDKQTVIVFPAIYASESDDGIKTQGQLYMPTPTDVNRTPKQLLRAKIGRHRFPVSPLSYIVSSSACKNIILESHIEDPHGIGLNEYATGYDELMLLEAIYCANTIVVEPSLSVYMMRNSDSISMNESGKGNHIRYAYARLVWAKAKSVFEFGSLADCARLALFGQFKSLGVALFENPITFRK